MKKYIALFIAAALLLAAGTVVLRSMDQALTWPLIGPNAEQDSDVAALNRAIDSLPDSITEADIEAVDTAAAQYEKLTAAQRARVRDAGKLTTAIETVSGLRDSAAARAVSKAFAALPATVTENDVAAIDAARASYEKLSDRQKGLVTGLELLSSAELAAQPVRVDIMIAAIGRDVTEDTRPAIEAARAAYDALTDSGKQNCTKYTALTELENKLASLGHVFKEGDKVVFTGGNIFPYSNSEVPSRYADKVSECTISFMKEDGLHPYHLISDDEGGIYGWVDASSFRLKG